MMNQYFVEKYKVMIGSGINSPSLRKVTSAASGARWLSNNVFVWAKQDHREIMVTVRPDDSFDDDNNYSIDITHDCIKVRRPWTTEYFEVPHISTEEEYFQQSTLHELMFPLELFIMITQLFDAVIERYCGVYK